MKFNSAVDGWFYWVLLFVAFTLLIAVLPPLKMGHISVIYAFALTAVSLGLPLWLLLSTYYEIDRGLLRIKSGPFTWKINISEIKSAKPSRNMISSPALSLNRIEIIYGNGKRILVSPKDRSGFFNAIGFEQYAT